MERWESLGYLVEASTTGIALSFTLDDAHYALAALHPGFAERKQEIILGWEGLRRKIIFSEEAIMEFQSSVGDLADVKTTANTAHIEIRKAFTVEKAEVLLRSMDEFVQAGKAHSEHLCSIEWDPRLPKIKFPRDPLVISNIQQTLQIIDARVQEFFAMIIQGWLDAGGLIECVYPGRIYLKIQTGEHEYGRYGVLSHRFNLAVLSAPRSQTEEQPSIELAWNLASGSYAYLAYAAQDVERYEEIVSQLPGFRHQDTHTLLFIDDYFDSQHASQLLSAMVELKSAAER
jgi:hypothetical protein